MGDRAWGKGRREEGKERYRRILGEGGGLK